MAPHVADVLSRAVATVAAPGDVVVFDADRFALFMVLCVAVALAFAALCFIVGYKTGMAIVRRRHALPRPSREATENLGEIDGWDEIAAELADVDTSQSRLSTLARRLRRNRHV